MKKFCESLRECTIKVIRFEKKKIIPLTSKEYGSYLKQTVAFPKISFKTNALLIKIMVKLRTIVILQVNIEVLHLAYVI